jgi:tRNA dimethylallyltransferase
VGKTAAAIRLAVRLDAEIISADSRQCYRELNIGVAKPDSTELAMLPHHFINSHSVKEDLNAAFYERFSVQKARELFQHRDRVVVVGGTGLYIKAFCEGLDDMPPADPLIRKQIQDIYRQKGLTWLQEQIRVQDPAFYREMEIQNPQRLIRALEFVQSTGVSILRYRSAKRKERDFRIIKVGLHLDREKLYDRINRRVGRMMEKGLEDEVKNLVAFKDLNALKTVGYKELFNYLEGKSSLGQAVESIQTNTRHYAKRQMTWFRRDAEIHWAEPEDDQAIQKITES